MARHERTFEAFHVFVALKNMSSLGIILDSLSQKVHFKALAEPGGQLKEKLQAAQHQMAPGQLVDAVTARLESVINLGAT